MNEFEIIEDVIQNKIVSYIEKYKQAPNFLKVPYWVYEKMKEEMRKYTTNYIRIDYQEGVIKYRGLAICPTIAIQLIDEIEVF